MAFDVVSNRALIGRLRSVARAIPFSWSVYRQYWRLRRWYESKKKYSESVRLVDLGDFPAPDLVFPVSQLCTANQMLSPIYDRWCDILHSPARFSRKQWEFVYILQVLEQAGMLSDAKHGLGFGCGQEPLPAIFASRGCQVLATDLERKEALEQGWVETKQHSASLEALYKSSRKFISERDFFSRVHYQCVDMNDIPRDFNGKFDFVWSACALEHLGSLKHGLDFIKNSLGCLSPGGVAVHTTEFNLSSNNETFESPHCSVYRAKDIHQLIADLEADGYAVAPLNLNSGTAPLDHYIDLPPYSFSPNIKLMLEGYVVTSIGLLIKKPSLSNHGSS